MKSDVIILTMKSDVIMPPPGIFNRPDLYSRRRWRRVQHIAGEFWSRWRKEFLQSLQARQKWNITKRNFQVGDIVLLKEDTGRNKWPMARIVNTEPDSQGIVQSVQLKVIDNNNNIKLFDDQSVRLCYLWKMSMVRFPTKGAMFYKSQVGIPLEGSQM